MYIGDQGYPVTFEEHDHGAHDHGATHRDHNMRAAIVHVLADAAVSVMVIVGLLLARAFGWAMPKIRAWRSTGEMARTSS